MNFILAAAILDLSLSFMAALVSIPAKSAEGTAML
jgi:hypothetical protein